jgi:hypothetical protein
VICYRLKCSRGHGFEGWFKNSDAYAREVEALDCPICGDRTIEKAIMAPAVLQRSSAAAAHDGAADPPGPGTAASAALPGAPASAAAPPNAAAAPLPAAMGPEQMQLAKALILMRKLRAHVEATFEHVGDRFAEEARKIHFEETEPRGIYGEATRDEVLSLEDEGIAIVPLPDLPKLDG